MLRLNMKQAQELIDEIERNGGNADSLKAALNDVKNPSNGQETIPASSGKSEEEEYLEEKRSQSDILHGTDLECLICHDKFDHLISGTCEVCWREWMLGSKPKGWLSKRILRPSFQRG